MKRLLVLRHAKSDRDHVQLTDFQRPLAPRGEQDAPHIGKALRERGVVPDLILSSTAVRARQTTEAVVKAAHLEMEPQFENDLYAASLPTLLEYLTHLPDTCSCALLVGHNPGLEMLVSHCTRTDAEMPTAALAYIEFDIKHWSAIEHEHGKLVWLLTPKHLDSKSA